MKIIYVNSCLDCDYFCEFDGNPKYCGWCNEGGFNIPLEHDPEKIFKDCPLDDAPEEVEAVLRKALVYVDAAAEMVGDVEGHVSQPGELAGLIRQVLGDEEVKDEQA